MSVHICPKCKGTGRGVKVPRCPLCDGFKRIDEKRLLYYQCWLARNKPEK